MISQEPSSVPPHPFHGDRLKLAPRQRIWVAYGLAILLTLAILLIHLMIGNTSNEPPSIILFIPAIMLSAYVVGIGPGLLATVLSCLITAYFLLPPVSPIHTLQWVSLLVIGVFISALSEGLPRARRKAEASQQVRALLAAIVESSDDAIIGKDLQGIVTSWNTGAARVFGYSASEMIGQPITLIIPPERLDEEQTILARISRGERVDHFETVRQRKDGSLIDVSVTVSPISNSRGQIIRALKIARDITARKRSEEALHRSEARFVIAFRANPTAMSITSLRDGRYIDINASHERLFGYPRDELIGQSAGSIQIYADPDQRAEVVRIMDEQGSLPATELTLRTRSGELREVLCSLEGLELDGEPCILGSVFDITDRKRAELLLQRSAEHLRVLANASRAFAEVGAEYEILLDHIAQTTTTVLGDACSIRLLSDDQKWMQVAALYDVNSGKIEPNQSTPGTSPIPVDDPSLPSQIFRTSQAQLIQVLDQEQIQTTTTQELWSLVQRIGVHSVIAAPMRVQAQVIGVLIVSRRQPTRPAFDQDDLNLTQDLADRAALAISNARLLQQVQHELDKRGQAELALRTSEQRYRQIVETAQEGIWQIDAANRTTFANAKMAEILGYSIDEMIGMALFDFMDAGGQAIATENVERRRQGIAEQHDFKFRHRNGSAIWAMVSTNPLQDEAGTYIGALAMVTDITERTEAEEQLRYQADLLAEVSDAIISTDINFMIKSWNAAAEALYGWAAHEVIGKNIVEILPTTYQDTKNAQVTAAFLHDGHWQGEAMQPHRDGTQRTIMSVVSLIKDSTGKPAGAVAVNRDISERKRAELLLQRAAERLRVLADASRTFAEVGTDYQTLLDQIARTITAGLGDSCAIRLISEDAMSLPLVAMYDQDPHKLELTRIVINQAWQRADDESPISQIFQKSQARLIPILSRDLLHALAEPQHWPLVDDLGMHSLMIVPMRVQGHAIGVLSVSRNRPEQPPYDEADLILTQDLADRAALAISNVRLLTQVQHELAERKLIQEVLRESEERLLTVTETAGIGLSLVDAQHRYRYLNQTQKDFLRLRPDDLTGQRVADVLGPLYEQSVRQRLERAFRGESVNEQLDLPRANSTELRHCEVRLQLGAYRTEPVVVIVIVDVTERKRAEQALRQSEERFAKAFRANPSALVIFRLHDGRFLDANETYQDLLGYSREELIGHNAQELNIFSDPATRTAMLHKMGEQGSLRNYEINVRTKFDEYRTILLSCEVVELDGEACVLSIGIDITERKRAEAEVRALSIELEQRVIDRTAELTAANKELEAFSYSVSHDLRAPLRAIDGFSRILLEDYIAELPEEAQHYFQLVRDNTQKMGHLVDDLLAFARLSRQPLNKRTTDPLVVINQCLEELRDEQTGRQITIEIGALPACQADPALLKQVWVNLITNALKYTRRRDPTVITIGSQSDGAALVYFIQDNGVGFDMHYSDKLFGVFQRMHRAEDYEGTGVGLAIVQRIVHRHGGRIWAEAVVDQGATFYFSLGDIS